MKIQISDKKKKEMFVSLFQILKNCSSIINTTFNSESLHIQGMDKSRVCLFDVKINSTWFNSFEITKKERKHLIEKASICVNGISLTISKVSKKGFQRSKYVCADFG